MTSQPSLPSRPIRWWPGILLVLAMIIAIAWVRQQDDWPFQDRNLNVAKIVIISGILLLVWWTFLSRAPNRLRLSITFSLVGLALVCAALFRVRGVSGDMMPIVEFRWANRTLPTVNDRPTSTLQVRPEDSARPNFPQFLGPNRDGILSGPRLETNWLANPPEILWRQKVGAAWSGFAIIREICLTQEQRGAEDCVVAYELGSGKQLWLYADKARYNTVVAGEGPRATPTVVSNRVFTCGGTGILNCLDLASGKLLWSRDLIAESGGKNPQWGYTCSPLVVDDLVIVHGGEGVSRSLFAFNIADGKRLWAGGASAPSYSSPLLATLAGVPQILSFNDGSISAHDPATGATLWERPWGNGNVVCAVPVMISTNQILFSSGYGVGAELLEIAEVAANQPARALEFNSLSPPNRGEGRGEGNNNTETNGLLTPALSSLGEERENLVRSNSTKRLVVRLVWKSIRMKSKFAHVFARDGNLYGLDDGIFACVNLADGSLRWKEGRYGHGQGLLVNDLYLLMAESGELVLLRPTSEAPNELARFRVFNSKTWNPIALSGDLLLARNDQEAVCLRLNVGKD